MEKSVKINNVSFDDVLFVKNGDNTIFANEIKEEFFGVFNLNLFNKNIICEGKSNDIVSCNVSLNNHFFKDIPFRIKKSKKNQIVINFNNLDGKNHSICEEIKRDAYDDLLVELKENEEKSKNELELIVEKAIMEKKKMSNEIMDLKEQIKQIEISNQRLLKEDNSTSKREELLNEFFYIKNQNDTLIEEKIESIHGYIMESVEERLSLLSKEASDHFKELNEHQIEQKMSDIGNEILEKSSKILEEKLLELENTYSNEMNDKLNAYSQTSGMILEDFKKSKKDTETLFNNHLNESVNSLKINFDELLKTHTDELKHEYSSKFENLIEEEKNNIKNESNQLIENQKNKIYDLLEKKSKEIEKKSNDIVLDTSDKIKDISKKIEKIENKLNKISIDGKKIEAIMQDTKRYTDDKMNQVLTEAKQFARLMLDYAGGGGSVAVQYAAGGNINGDITINGSLSATEIYGQSAVLGDTVINGDLDVKGSMTATQLLSGGTDLTKIFAGEGELDDNPIDGGLF